MDINRMRLGLVYIFSENKKISKQAKLQLINFVEQADEYQLKVLMMDGELVSKDKLDKQVREIVNDRFDESMLKNIFSASLKGILTLTELREGEGKYMAQAAAVGAAVGGTVYAAMRIKAGRACKKMFPEKGDERRKTCVKNYMQKWNKSDAAIAARKQKAAKEKAAHAKMKTGLPK